RCRGRAGRTHLGARAPAHAHGRGSPGGHSAERGRRKAVSTLRIATRKSPLALWQARFVAKTVSEQAKVSCELLEMSTEGDRFLSAPLSQIGGKGTFVKEIEQAILDGRADFAVHSLKDMTSTLPDGLVLTAVVDREDPRDAFVSPDGKKIDQLLRGAV